MLKFAIYVLACILPLIPHQVRAEADKISVLFFFKDSGPWCVTDTDGKMTGVVVDQAEALLQEAGFAPQFIKLPWSRALQLMQIGQLDMMLNLSKTEEREKFIYYLGVMGEEQNVVGVDKEYASLALHTLDDLAQPGLKWGLRQDMFYSLDFNKRLAENEDFRRHFEFDPVGSKNLEKVKKKWLTGMVADFAALSYSLKNTSDKHLVAVREVPFFVKTPIYIGLSRKLPQEKIDRLQTAYDSLAQRRVFEKIFQKWLNDEGISLQ